VELSALSADDFVRILTEPNASLTEQYTALLATEGVDLTFAEDGIKRIAEMGWQVNETTENIGARRLHTMLEKLLEEISFEASDLENKKVVIDEVYVNKYLGELVKDEDLSRYIL
jgi:ATP-dependent HslUV protease ATP-binding subunit HslU